MKGKPLAYVTTGLICQPPIISFTKPGDIRPNEMIAPEGQLIATVSHNLLLALEVVMALLGRLIQVE